MKPYAAELKLNDMARGRYIVRPGLPTPQTANEEHKSQRSQLKMTMRRWLHRAPTSPPEKILLHVLFGSQQRRQCGFKSYSFPAPYVECIGKRTASAPYEFGRAFPLSPPMTALPEARSRCRPRHCAAFPMTAIPLKATIKDIEWLASRAIERIYVDKGCRRHDAPEPHRVFVSGQMRGIFGATKRELRHRSAIEPLIGHMKAEAKAISSAAVTLKMWPAAPPSATTSVSSPPG